MGVEGCTKCIKYLLFVFNFVFWVSGAQGGVRGGADAQHLGQALLPRARPGGGGRHARRSCETTCGLRAWGEGPGPPHRWTAGTGSEPRGSAFLPSRPGPVARLGSRPFPATCWLRSRVPRTPFC